MAAPVTPSEVASKLVAAERRGDYFNAGSQMSRDFASLFGASFNMSDAVYQSTQGGITLGYNGFGGFASEIGVRQNFDAVNFAIYPHDAANMPKQARVFIRELTYDGNLLASVVVPLPNLTPKQSVDVTAELGTLITNPSGLEMVLGVSADGYIGYGAAAEYPANLLRYRAGKVISETIPTAVVSPYYEIFARTFNSGSRNAFSNGLYSAYDHASSTFTAWGNVLSSKPSGLFNVAQIWLYAFDADYLPSKVRIRFRDAAYNGTIVGTATANVSFSTTGLALATLYFDNDVDLSSVGPVWFEFLADGRVAHTFSDVLSTATERYGLAGIDGTVALPVGGAIGRQPWVRCILQDRAAGIAFDAGLLAKAINQQSATQAPFVPSVRLNLPPKIYCVEGIESNIYWDGCLDASVPHELFDKNVTASYGQQLDHRWRLTPVLADAGTSSMTIDVDFDRTQQISKTTSLVIKADSVGSGQSRKVLLIGDSIMNRGNTIAQTIVDNVAASASTLAVTLLGTQGAGSYKHEGRSGWTFTQFATSGSPFWISGALNFAQYLADNSYTMAATDSVFIQLGTNDFFSTSRANIVTGMATALAYLQAIIASIQAAVPGVNIWVCLTPQPAFTVEGQGRSYNSTYDLHTVKRNYADWRETLIAQYGSGANNVRIAPTSCAVDTRNNFTTETDTLNARNATEAEFQTDNVHPATSGLQQLGDAIYCCIKSLES